MKDGTVVRGGWLVPSWAFPVLLVAALGVFGAMFNEREARIARDAAMVEKDKARDKMLNDILTQLKLNDVTNGEIKGNYNEMIGYMRGLTGKPLSLKPIDVPPKIESPERENQ